MTPILTDTLLLSFLSLSQELDMAASVKQLDNGQFAVVCDGEIVAGPFETNAAAWRAADRYSGEAINRSENVSEWVFRKMGDPA